jgi:hypothetical protein
VILLVSAVLIYYSTIHSDKRLPEPVFGATDLRS